MDLQTLFLGEPEYDNNGRIVGRKLGVQNMIVWLFIGLVGYQLMCREGKKQKGGAISQRVLSVLIILWFAVLIVINVVSFLFPVAPTDNPGPGTTMFLGSVIWIVGSAGFSALIIVPLWLKK